MMHHHTTFGYKTFNSSDDIVGKKVIEILNAVICDFDFEQSSPIFLLHHHTKFGYKTLSGSEGIFLTKPGDMDWWTHRHSDSNITSLQ